MAQDPQHGSTRPDWWARGIGLAQVAATVAVAGLGAYLVAHQKRSDAVEVGRAAKVAYAVRLGVVAHGVRDMLKCREKLVPYATGDGTRLAFQDLKILGAVLGVSKLRQIQEASDQLDRLFPPGYSAPIAGSDAAYRAWTASSVLQHRAITANALLRKALAALGEHAAGTDPCYGRQRKARSVGVPVHSSR